MNALGHQIQGVMFTLNSIVGRGVSDLKKIRIQKRDMVERQCDEACLSAFRY